MKAIMRKMRGMVTRKMSTTTTRKASSMRRKEIRVK